MLASAFLFALLGLFVKLLGPSFRVWDIAVYRFGGGFILLLILNKLIMTKTMTVDFLKPIMIGQKMKAVGGVLEYKNDREAIIEGFIYNDEEVLCAKGTGTFALFTLEVLMKMGIMDDGLINDLKRLFSKKGPTTVGLSRNTKPLTQQKIGAIY